MIERPRPKLDKWLNDVGQLVGSRDATDDERARFKRKATTKVTPQLRKAPPLRVYIAGPMRGYDQFNFPAFDEAAAWLRARGYEVFSPAEHDRETGFDETLNELGGFSLTDAMRWDIARILEVDAVFLLKGWRESSGVATEMTVARAVGVPVYELKEYDCGHSACQGLCLLQPEAVPA